MALKLNGVAAGDGVGSGMCGDTGAAAAEVGPVLALGTDADAAPVTFFWGDVILCNARVE